MNTTIPPGCRPRARSSRVACGLALILSGFALEAPASAQQQSAQNYYEFLPAAPSIVAQTDASVRFQLYGDPADPNYLDVTWKDGVDDRRAERLLMLAERFSPMLRRNTYLVPMEFEDVLDEQVRIHVDVWRDNQRVDSGVVELGGRVSMSGDARNANGGGNGNAYRSSAAIAPDDSILRGLLSSLGPRRMRTPITRPDSPPDTILYIDVPGEDEFSWRPRHANSLPELTRMYAHPFIHESAAGGGRYEFLIQYWLYYAFNDGANNHEGDWEHITVSITTAERVRETAHLREERGLLEEQDLLALLHPDRPTPLDSLRIGKVAYYFHNNVMILDYPGIEAGETMWRGAEENDGAIHVWEDTRYMDNVVRRRMRMAGGQLATHPVGYIGGNNKGMDELLQAWPRFQRSYNRDSHGTYPFPGVWREVGPLDATEKIYGDVAPRLVEESGRSTEGLQWHELIDDDRYLLYRADDIILMPDWERLEPVLDDPEVRRRWAWFILPMHMGYPTTPSPGAGTLKRVDLGNVAPMSPAYNSAWNRPGVTAVYPEYDATVLRVAFAPISPITNLQSGWGALNIPLVIWGLLPGGNVAITQLLPWVTGGMNILGSPPAKTFYTGPLPERFTSVSGGGYRQIGGNDFARLLPPPSDPAVREAVGEEAVDGVRIRDARQLAHWGSRAWFNIYYGPRLSVENTLGYGESSVSYRVEGPEGEPLGLVAGTLYTRDLTGGLTYRLYPAERDFFRIYGRLGYGWSSYTLTAVTIGSQPVVDRESYRGGRLPTLYPSVSWWPNTSYAGLGLEVFSPPKYWLFKRLGVGARLEVGGSLHRLAIGGECNCRVTAERGDVAFMLLFGW